MCMRLYEYMIALKFYRTKLGFSGRTLCVLTAETSLRTLFIFNPLSEIRAAHMHLGVGESS